MNNEVIDDFVDQSSSTTRDLVRLCKLIKEADSICNNKIKSLEDNKKSFLMNKRNNFQKSNERELRTNIDQDCINIKDMFVYKSEILKDLKFMIENHHKKLNEVISVSEKQFKNEFHYPYNERKIIL